MSNQKLLAQRLTRSAKMFSNSQSLWGKLSSLPFAVGEVHESNSAIALTWQQEVSNHRSEASENV